MCRLELNGMDYTDLRRKVVGSVVRIDNKISTVERVRACDGDDDCYLDEDEEGRNGGEDTYLLVTGNTESRDSNGKLCWSPYVERCAEENKEFFNLSFPEPGYVNYKGGSLYVTRLAQRQWHLGLHPSCTTISDKFSKERETSGNVVDMKTIFSNIHFLSRMYNRRYMTYYAVLNSILNKERIGGCINRYVYIGRSLLFPHMVICYKDAPVGYIDRETLTPYLFSPAEYVQKVLPVTAHIKENVDGITVRTKWY